MATNNILPWASGTDANVLTDADYASALAQNGTYQNGVQAGQASSKQANKTWRQAAAPASGVAQFIVDNLEVDVSDGDAPSVFSARLANASIKLGQISPYNSDYAASVGGYKLNDIVSDASTPGTYWRSTVSNNLTVPGASGANWNSLLGDYATQQWVGTNFVKQGYGFSNFGNNQIYLGWRTDGSGLGLGVDSTDVGTIVLKKDVMPSQAVFGQASQVYYTPTPSSSQTTTHIVDLTFTAPYDGLVYASASFNVSNIQPSQCQGLIQIKGSSYQPSSGSTLWSDTTLFPMSGSGLMRVKKGDNVTVLASYNIPPSSSQFASVGQTITYTFTPAGY